MHIQWVPAGSLNQPFWSAQLPAECPPPLLARVSRIKVVEHGMGMSRCLCSVTGASCKLTGDIKHSDGGVAPGPMPAPRGGTYAA